MKVTGPSEILSSAFGNIKTETQDIVNAIVKELFFGNRPAELYTSCLSYLKEVIRSCTSCGIPIHISIPWESKVGYLDAVDLHAINTLIGMKNRISKIYNPGIKFQIMIRDLSERFSYKQEEGASLAARDNYFNELEKLLKIMNLDCFSVDRESSHVSYETFKDNVELYSGVLFTYMLLTKLHGTEQCRELEMSREDLELIGWTGGVHPVTKSLLIERFKRLYPELSNTELDLLVARYLACALFRKRWMIGDKGFKLIFGDKPSLGSPTENLYLRLNRTNLAPWNSKGVVWKEGPVKYVVAVVPIGRDLEDTKKGSVTFTGDDGTEVTVNISYC